MEQKQLEMLKKLTDGIGENRQLLNVNKACAQMQIMVSELLGRAQIPRPVFNESVADLYVMLNALTMMYGVNTADIDSIATAKLEASLKAFGQAVAENGQGHQETGTEEEKNKEETDAVKDGKKK